MYVSEVTEEGKFYACNVSDGPALETLMDGLRFVIGCSHPIDLAFLSKKKETFLIHCCRHRAEFATSPPLAGAYTPKKGDLCAAKFVDDQWYRARIEKMSSVRLLNS